VALKDDVFKTTVALKTGNKSKRPKHAPGSGTPKSRAIMLGIVALCVVAVFLIPKPVEDINSKGFEQAVVQPAPPTATVVPVAIPVQSRANNGQAEMPVPLSMLPAGTPDEVKARLEVIEKVVDHPNPRQRDAAFQATLALGPELVPQLPKLIETSTGIALTNYALAAKHLKAVNTVPALIARIEKTAQAHFEMFGALASFQDPKAQAYVLAAMKETKFMTREEVWNSIGENFTSEQEDFALKVAAGDGSESLLAAAALGRAGKTPERATALVQKILPVLNSAKATVKLALLKSLAAMDAGTTANSMISFSFDPDPNIRALALSTMLRSPSHKSMAIEAFHNEADVNVKAPLVAALIETPCEALYPDLIKLLAEPMLHGVAHRALVAANKGRDRGNNDFDWIVWLKEIQTAKKPLPAAVSPETIAEEIAKQQ
jgi:hypothetical protein